MPRRNAAASVKCFANASLVATSIFRGSTAIARPRNATSLRTLRKVRTRGAADGPARKESARSRASSAAAVVTAFRCRRTNRYHHSPPPTHFPSMSAVPVLIDPRSRPVRQYKVSGGQDPDDTSQRYLHHAMEGCQQRGSGRRADKHD